MTGIITDSVMKPAEAVVPSNSVSWTGVGSQQVGILLFCENAMSINVWEDPESIKVTIFETSFDDKGMDNEFEEGITFSLTASSKTVCMCLGWVQHCSHMLEGLPLSFLTWSSESRLSRMKLTHQSCPR